MKNILKNLISNFHTFSAIPINKFDYSEIKQQKSEKKVYSIDNGILTALDFSFSENKGKLLENLIALELLKFDYNINYFKDNYECDFIIKNNNNYTPVQVSYTLSNAETKQREIKGLIACCSYLNINRCIIVTYDEESSMQIENTKIEINPAYKFLLENKQYIL